MSTQNKSVKANGSHGTPGVWRGDKPSNTKQKQKKNASRPSEKVASNVLAVEEALCICCTGQPLEQLCPWWMNMKTMTKTLITNASYADLATQLSNHYFGVHSYSEDELPMEHATCLVSWRAKDAPLFTLSYRGLEAEALKNSPVLGIATDASRTVMFSHDTGHTYAANPAFHLCPGDPPLIVQCITDTCKQTGVVSMSVKVVDVDTDTNIMLPGE